VTKRKEGSTTRPRRFWTEAECETVKNLYANTATEQIAKLLDRRIDAVYRFAYKLGLRKSAEYLASPAAVRFRRGDNVGETSRFTAGHVPANKGLRRPGYAPGRMGQTQFKKGERRGSAAENWCPIGTIRADGEGFLRIKVREGRKGEPYGFGNTKLWPLLNRHVWEQHHGPILPGHAVVFKDKDRTNCSIDNLELISRRELLHRNSVHRWGQEVFEVIQMRGALNRKLRKLSEKQNDGPAESPVRDARSA